MKSLDLHFYIEKYSIHNDPYCQENGVLINLLNINETSKLNEIEAEFSALALQKLLKKSPPNIFNINTLKMYFGQFFIDLSTEYLTYTTNLSQNKPKSLSALNNNQYHPHYFKSGK